MLGALFAAVPAVALTVFATIWSSAVLLGFWLWALSSWMVLVAAVLRAPRTRAILPGWISAIVVAVMFGILLSVLLWGSLFLLFMADGGMENF